jgi:hypothetical protein
MIRAGAAAGSRGDNAHDEDRTAGVLAAGNPCRVIRDVA